MPLYEYECDACGHRFEVIRKFTDSPLMTCPECGGPIHKLQSVPSFQLKGTGWYVTDYPKPGQAAVDKGTGDGGGSSSDKEPPKGDKGGTGDKSGKGDGSEKPSTSAGKAEKTAKGVKGKGAATSEAASSPPATGTKPPG